MADSGQLRSFATVYYKPERNRSTLQPDYFVHATSACLVFSHELQGLTRDPANRDQ